MNTNALISLYRGGDSFHRVAVFNIRGCDPYFFKANIRLQTYKKVRRKFWFHLTSGCFLKTAPLHVQYLPSFGYLDRPSRVQTSKAVHRPAKCCVRLVKPTKWLTILATDFTPIIYIWIRTSPDLKLGANHYQMNSARADKSGCHGWRLCTLGIIAWLHVHISM